MTFRPRTINGRWTKIVPEHIARWDALSMWEPERFASMETTLKPGMTLFDVGAEQGPLSVVYADFVGAANMVLFEPHPAVWPNIRMTWEANGLDLPAGGFCGLVSDRTDLAPPDLDFDTGQRDGWPIPAWGAELHTAVSYRLIPEHAGSTPQTTLDDWVAANGIAPDAITVDVEGAELRVMRGAARTLAEHRPLVWISVHPDMMVRQYGDTGMDLYRLMRDAGYTADWLARDHEEHILFRAERHAR